MQPYSKRPHHQPQQVFHRHQAIGQASYTPSGYSVPPAAPHSLAPVAMGQYSERSHYTDRGVANTVQVRTERPTWRTGAMILLAGVFVGGTFGVGVQARRNAMDARAEMAPAAVAPATQLAAPPPVQATAPGPTALQVVPPQAPPQAYAQAPASANLPPGAIVMPPMAGVTVVPATPAAPAAPAAQAQAQAPTAAAPAPQKKAPAPAWHAPSRPAAPHGGIIAAKVPQPPKAEKPAPPPPAEKPDKPEKAEKAAPKKGTSDAEKILKDAIGETTNTL